MASESREVPVRSPCIKVCQLDPESGLCRGCLRTADEIARWGSATNPERQDILRRVEDRLVSGRFTKILSNAHQLS
ncbi:MAG: DUF1289 domain-containing protein [Hyphomicrobiales bacterium]|nr:DUF1289 domain-containing protein [Hyphomicrobiales bacterium]